MTVIAFYSVVLTVSGCIILIVWYCITVMVMDCMDVIVVLMIMAMYKVVMCYSVSVMTVQHAALFRPQQSSASRQSGG